MHRTPSVSFSSSAVLPRRQALGWLAAGTALWLAGCDRVSTPATGSTSAFRGIDVTGASSPFPPPPPEERRRQQRFVRPGMVVHTDHGSFPARNWSVGGLCLLAVNQPYQRGQTFQARPEVGGAVPQVGSQRDEGDHRRVPCSATTRVRMPPRMRKSPSMRIHWGWRAATRSSRIRLVTASWKAPSLR